jgi:hypothetical protein
VCSKCKELTDRLVDRYAMRGPLFRQLVGGREPYFRASKLACHSVGMWAKAGSGQMTHGVAGSLSLMFASASFALRVPQG